MRSKKKYLKPKACIIQSLAAELLSGSNDEINFPIGGGGDASGSGYPEPQSKKYNLWEKDEE